MREHHQQPNESGDLKRLYNQARQLLGIQAASGAGQATHQILGGLSTVVDGIAGLSNLAGDRHGLAGGERLSELGLAGLAVHAAGSMAVFLLRSHKECLRGSMLESAG